jgi:uncharacterized glyoxalase superfamily protein PhnB
VIVNRSAPRATVVPVLVYPDVKKAIEWLTGAFGFVERLRAPGPDGVISHAQLNVGDGAIMIGRSGGPFTPPRSDEITRYVLIHVDSVIAHHERAKRFGAEILQAPQDMPFGERQYMAVDLAGHRWAFTESIADVAPEAWGAVVATART